MANPVYILQMEACNLKTLDDLLANPEERVELIDGEIVRRPMVRSDSGQDRARIPPFDSVELDLAYILGE